MHILHIVSTMRPEAGGPAEAVRMMLTHQPSGYTSEVLTLDPPSSNPHHNLGPVASTFGYTPRLIPWLRANRHRFDGVILHGLWQYLGFAALVSLPGHVPYVVFTHGMLDPYFKKTFPWKHLKKWPYWLLSDYWLLRRAHRVLFTTNAERDLAAQSFWLHRWRSAIVPLGTDPAPAVTPSMHDAFYDRCPGARGHRFLLFLGRIDPKKGPDMLLDAFLAVAHQDPGLHLVMAGPHQTPWAQGLITKSRHPAFANRVHWPGMLQGSAKHAAFDLCEAFVLPSHQENFGIAVVEALAASRPVLISTQINIAAEISTDACGIVAADTPSGTLKLLQQWIVLSPQAKQNMRLQAEQSFRQRYDMRRNTEAILRIFDLPATPAEPR